MYATLRKLFTNEQRSASHSRVGLSPCRPQLESLEDRAVPNATAFQAFQHLAADVRGDLVAVRQDVQAISRLVGSTATSAVKTDLKTVTTDLNKVFNDVAAGKSATTDINTLTTAINKLTTDLGTGISKALQKDLHLLTNNLTDAATDLTNLTQALNKALTNVQNAATALTTALSANTDVTVNADIEALNTDLATVSANISAGVSATASVHQVGVDLNQLIHDLGNTATATVRQDISTLRTAINSLSADLKSWANLEGQLLHDIESQANHLARELARNTLATIRTDVRALSTALLAVIKDFKAGTAATIDMAKLIAAETKLVTDLGSIMSSELQNQLSGFSNSLLDLALELAELKMQQS